MGSPMHLPPEYDDIQPLHYDAEYTAEISKRMKVPFKLGPAGEDFTEPNTGVGYLPRVPAPMEVPDKIMVNGDDNHQRRDLKLDLHEFDPTMSNGEYVGLVTPPRTLTLSEGHFPHLEDTEEPQRSKPHRYTAQNGYLTPRSDRYLNQDLLGAGESSLLLQDESDDVSRLQVQVAKLTRHVMRLEDESKQRDTRDLILYCIMSSYFLLKLANWLVRK